MRGNSGREPFRELDGLRIHFEDLLRPAGLRALEDYNKQILKAINPPVLRTFEDYNKQILNAINPPGLRTLQDFTRQIQRLNRQIQKAIYPPALRTFEDYNKQILNAISPPALRSFVELSRTRSISYGPRMTEYAETIGRSVVEHADQVPNPPGGQDEAPFAREFAPLNLTSAEANALYWVFATTISLLATGAAGSSDEASRALQTLLGFMIFFLTLYGTFGKK